MSEKPKHSRPARKPKQPKGDPKAPIQKASRPKEKKPKKSRITPAGALLRKVGGIAGGFLGNASLGTSLGAGISRIFGQGDYRIQRNSLVSGGGPPSFASLNSGMRVHHREFLSDVVSSIDYNVSTFDLTPTNNQTFPWLSRMAPNFEEWQLNGLVFYFNTTCGSAISSTNNALGAVGMTTVYDPSDAPLSSKRECEDYVGCVAGVPSNSLLHPVECKPKANVLDRKFIQLSPPANPEDKKFYSHGTLNLFTEGMQQAGVTIGELWVAYDVTFYDPKILPIGAIEAAASNHYTEAPADATHILGTTDFTMTGALGVTYTDGVFTIPKGTSAGPYLILFLFEGAVSSFEVDLGLLPDNVITVDTFRGNTDHEFTAPPSANAVAQRAYVAMIIKTDSQSAAISPVVSSGTISVEISAQAMFIRYPFSSLFLENLNKVIKDHREKLLFAQLFAQLKASIPAKVCSPADSMLSEIIDSKPVSRQLEVSKRK